MILIGIGTAGCNIARGVNRAFGEDLRYVLADTDAASKGYVDTEVEAAETAASTADTNILTGVTAFSKIRLRDENDEDWYLTVDAANETLVIAKITA